MELNYVEGDATRPIGDGPKILVHVCNDIGRWGKGFVLAVSRRWPVPEKIFKASFAAGLDSALGDVQFVHVEDDLEVANLVGQHGIANRGGTTPPIRYDAIGRGLQAVRDRAQAFGASVHMPRIGAGLAGGDWQRIEAIIVATLVKCDVPTTVYDLPPPDARAQASRLVR